MRAEEVEIYYDPGELFAGLLKGQPLSDQHTNISQQLHFGGLSIDDNKSTH